MAESAREQRQRINEDRAKLSAGKANRIELADADLVVEL
jgi:hypothetical protein